MGVVMRGRIGQGVRALAQATLLGVLLLLLLEGGLRLFLGFPRGLFHYEPYDRGTLFLPNREMRMVMGPLPYTIKTNSHGLRGPEISRRKPDGVTRIVALGDSVTHGFFVPNAKTYPVLLEKRLRARGHEVEVLNVAIGSSSIDRQLAMLKAYGTPLDPDIVVLQFVTNDLDEIRETTRQAMLTHSLERPMPEAASEWFWFGRTAIGEWVLDTVMRWQYPQYRRHSRVLAEGEDPEIVLSNGADFERNARHFLSYMVERQGSLLRFEEFGPEQQVVMDRYVHGLKALRDYCEQQGMKLLLTYHPDYAHIYLPERLVPIYRSVRAACERLEIPFVDQLSAFRAHGEEVLHFAPLDYHPNAAGNALIADVVADALEPMLADG